ncbi:MAG TPA: type II toxin-antitoxin system PemK/MazF family toxin [Candidatus Paceibacterota bacterium]|nr:type II toxin-antitoxin system PemK/MazF family toxin [Candidatus Paceibacterota bacterium]
MQKDFDRWNAQKSKLNNEITTQLFKEREIWFCYLGLNIGHEQDGGVKTFLRPVIVLKKISNEMFFGIPLTRTPRFGKEYFTIINNHGVGFAMLSQGRTLDARRIKYCSAIIPEDEFESLKLCFLLF